MHMVYCIGFRGEPPYNGLQGLIRGIYCGSVGRYIVHYLTQGSLKVSPM